MTTARIYFATLALAAALAGGAAVADSGCVAVSGPFETTQVYPPECTSATGLCTHGVLHGDIVGTYDFSMDSLAPALDPADPTLFVFTGTSLIETADGTMTAHDTGRLWYNVLAPSPFETIVNIDGGSGAYEGASGRLVATGELDFSTGRGVGTYTGDVCAPAA